MSSNNNYEIISEAKPHTVQKFELIERYVEEWMHKLLNYGKCEKLIFIDCMCNSGEYIDVDGKQVFGTGVRVANLLHDASFQYPNKQILIFLNDIDSKKTDHIRSILPNETNNFKIHISSYDKSEFLIKLGAQIVHLKNTHTLLIYDPYKAEVDWNAVMPFFNTWGEVILNHMVFDTIRAVALEEKKNNLKPETIIRYEQTYRTEFRNLIPYGSNRKAYEERIEAIMSSMRKQQSREFYIASFPFFSRSNSLIYNLVHYTNNDKGFSLFKKVAWQTFGAKSSFKNTHGNEDQFVLGEINEPQKTLSDEECYYIKDIAEYLQNIFAGKSDVPLYELWKALEEHPIFPSEGFRKEIRKALRDYYNADDSRRSKISFKDGSAK